MLRLLLSVLFRSILACVCALCVIYTPAHANNLQLMGKAKMTHKDEKAGTAYINFQAKWDNSWRTTTPDNWDAIWVFAKFKHNETKWEHVHFDTNASAHYAHANVPLEISVGQSQTLINGKTITRGVGVFVYRKQNGRGGIYADSFALKWNYLQQLEEKNVEYVELPISLRIYAIEMVYVPRGPFWFGDNGTTGSDITINNTTGEIYPHKYHQDEYGGVYTAYYGKMPLIFLSNPTPSALASSKWASNASYPNGFEPFYIMKYEVSQHAYVDFLNTLTYEQQLQRCAAALPHLDNYARFYTGNRNMVTVRLPGIPVTPPNPSYPATYGVRYPPETRYDWDVEYNGGNLPMTFMSWSDGVAYLAWSGLRPMTELEYEKTCRGFYAPMKNEYAWGNDQKVDIIGLNTLNAYKGTENASNPNANFIMQTGTLANYFPMRVGCFATGVSTRKDAGATYYGAMNLSDNVSELYINCTTKEGLAFDGSHGYGHLDLNTALPVLPSPTWPSTSSIPKGLGIRGVHAADAHFVSSRTNMDNATILSNVNNRYHLLGCRGGRTAPE